MITVNAHFDGKAIIPDEPLDLPQDQNLIVRIEPICHHDEIEQSALAWLATNAVENDTLPANLADQHDHYLYGCPARDAKR